MLRDVKINKIHLYTKRLMKKLKIGSRLCIAEVVVNNKNQLKKQISHIELQIKKLQLKSNDSEIYDDLYNSLVLKKAVLKKELENMSKNPLIEKAKRLIPHKEKLICDYFS